MTCRMFCFPSYENKKPVCIKFSFTFYVTQSCSAKRKRRDVGGNTRQETVYLNLNIVDIPENKTGLYFNAANLGT